MTEQHCSKRVYSDGSFREHMCQSPHWKDGYCKIHHPETARARQAKRENKWKEQQKVWDRQRRIQKAEKSVLDAAEAWADGVGDTALSAAVEELRKARE